MKVLLKVVLGILLLGIVGNIMLLINYIQNRGVKHTEYVEVAGLITQVDKINNTYKVKVDSSIFEVETILPLPETNKQIIILLPK